MADAVASQTLFDGERQVIMKFTNISDGTGESKVLKVDVSALTANAAGKACDGVSLTSIIATTEGMGIILYWDATTDVVICTIPPNTNYRLKMADFGGFWNDSGTGKTGDVLLSTTGASANDNYTLTLVMTKHYAA